MNVCPKCLSVALHFVRRLFNSYTYCANCNYKRVEHDN